jgi:hypothetical protein
MRLVRRAACLFALTTALAAAVAAPLPLPIAEAAIEAPLTPAAQYYGSGWGSPYWGPGYGYSAPYVGSAGYPYYRYGSYYGSAYGLPYPVPPSFGAYYSDGFAPWAPFLSGGSVPPYSSAGGVALGGDYAGGYVAPLGRCLYSNLAGIGGSWTDPQSYGYYAPFC